MDACSSSSRATPSVPGGPNEHFATEAEAARALGIVVRTIDHDALTAGDVRVAVRLVDEPSDDAVYREWMVRSEHYDLLGHALVARDVRLRASPADYRRAHELPGWYDAFSGLTPESRWLASAGVDGIDVLLRGFPAGAAVLKDYVKSMKHRWDEAAFIPNTEDTAAVRSVATRFLELRGDDLVGGIVIRKFESFVGAEARTWWVRGVCRLVTAHPDSPDAPPAAGIPVNDIAHAVATLAAPFVTVDLAQSADGRWRIIEVGDGQVSDRPISTDPAELIAALQS